MADKASEAKVNGVYLLICKDQNHKNSTWIEEEVGEESRQKAFTESDRKELHRIFDLFTQADGTPRRSQGKLPMRIFQRRRRRKSSSPRNRKRRSGARWKCLNQNCPSV